MQASEQSSMSTESVVLPPAEAVLAVARPNTQGPFAKADTRGWKANRPIGVAALLEDHLGTSLHLMSGYALSDDMARAAMVWHLLRYIRESGSSLFVFSKGFDVLQYLLGAQKREGLNAELQPFPGYDIFEPIYDAQTTFAWDLIKIGKGEEPAAYAETEKAARVAAQVAVTLQPEFLQYRGEHPEWHMLKTDVASSGR